MRFPVPLLVAVGVLIAGAGVALVTSPKGEATAPGAAERVPIGSATLACPASSADGATRTTTVTALNRATGGEGSAVLTESVPDGDTQLALAPGQPVAHVVEKAGQHPLVGRARGSAAPGFATDMVVSAAEGPLRGLAGVACTAPTTEFWFVGVSFTAPRVPRLHLVNPEEGPATVRVELLTQDGEVLVPETFGGVVLSGGESTEIRLDTDDAVRAAMPAVAAVHVTVASGRVTAGLQEEEAEGTSGTGHEWVPPAGLPGRRLVLPGVPAGGKPTLQVVNPGDDPVEADLMLTTEGSEFVPAGAETLRLAPGQVATVDLSAAVATVTEASSITVAATGPVLASARISTGTGEKTETAFTVGTPALTGPAVAVTNRVASATSTLILSHPVKQPGAGADTPAPEGSAAPAEAELRVVVVGPGAGKPLTVRVPAGRTVEVPVRVGGDQPFAIVVEPVSGGPVHAARVLTDSSSGGVTVLPLVTQPTTAEVPVVVPAP